MLAAYIVIGLALVLAMAALWGETGKARYFAAKLSQPPDPQCPPASVVVPVKGEDEALAANLASLAALDYPDYELLVVARAAEDVPAGAVPTKARTVWAGAGDSATGEKINNLLAGIKAARPQSKIFAFADSDNQAGPGWLRSLVSELADPAVGAATGYRFHVPARAAFWSDIRSVWNAVIFGGFGPGDSRLAWGGAMAIRRDVFNKIKVAERWRGTVSDDYRLTEAVRAAGLRVAFAPGAVVADVSHTTAGELLAWIERQMVITRVYAPGLWWLALVSHAIYCASMVLSAIYVPFLLLLQVWLGMIKGRNRARLARAALPAHDRWFRWRAWTHTLYVPLVTWLWLWGLLASARTRTIRWRGREYRLARPGSS